jgi:hypothetical protein
MIEALLFAISIRIGSRVVGVPRNQAALRRWAFHTKPNKFGAGDLIRDARRAQRIAKILTGIDGNCLVRSLTLWNMLLRRGVSTDLRFAFRKLNEKIGNHPQLEYEGTPINETVREAQTYQPFDRPINYDYLRSHL